MHATTRIRNAVVAVVLLATVVVGVLIVSVTRTARVEQVVLISPISKSTITTVIHRSEFAPAVAMPVVRPSDYPVQITPVPLPTGIDSKGMQPTPEPLVVPTLSVSTETVTDTRIGLSFTRPPGLVVFLSSELDPSLRIANVAPVYSMQPNPDYVGMIVTRRTISNDASLVEWAAEQKTGTFTADTAKTLELVPITIGTMRGYYVDYRGPWVDAGDINARVFYLQIGPLPTQGIEVFVNSVTAPDYKKLIEVLSSVSPTS